MNITYEDLPQVIVALKRCAKEHEQELVPTGWIHTTQLCDDVAQFLQELVDNNKAGRE